MTREPGGSKRWHIIVLHGCGYTTVTVRARAVLVPVINQ